MAAVPTSSLSDNQRQELLCTYAALVLSDEGMEISAENIKKLVTAAGGSVEPYMPGLFARALRNHKVEDLIAGAGSAAVAAPAAAAAAAPAAGGSAAPAEKGGKPAKQEEPEEEEDADMGFSLFD